MPSPTYVGSGAAGMQKGVANAEVGIKIDSFDTSISDEKALAYDENGSVCGFAHNFNPSITISLSGEVSNEDASGSMCLSQYGTAITFANVANAKLTDPIGTGDTADTAYAGVTAGGFYLEDISYSESRDGFRTLSMTAISYPGLA
tara:strand:- start:2992 stop:3429 length:438 start_codon:yes stop_codon:yes gene_type:complete